MTGVSAGASILLRSSEGENADPHPSPTEGLGVRVRTCGHPAEN